jgi:signal transduction histidine kinase
VVLERGGRGHGIPRWTVATIERFVAHAALALANARLRDERDAQLETIQLLERDLRVHADELEERVAARTAELRETVETLRETDEQRRRLLDHVVRVAEEERQRIANDVHDDPVQNLVALKMRLELLVKAHPANEDMARAKIAVEGVLHSMRHLMFDLRPPVLDEAELDDALRYLLEQSELPFGWSVEGTTDHAPGEQARVILYRIAQEAVTNARKHSQAETITMRLASRNGGTWLEIVDDGVGFLPQDAVVAAPGHLGLAAMRERAEMAGGTCEVRSLPGAGTSVTVWIPTHDMVAPVQAIDRLDPENLTGRARAS